MNSSQVSCELLAHFDLSRGDSVEAASPRPVRGITWVLAWAAAAAVLFFASCLLIRFGYCIAAERVLGRAARAGALEATLPHATHRSITATIERRLAANSMATRELEIALFQNGAPARGLLQIKPGDRLAISLSVPTNAVLPPWLQVVGAASNNPRLEARAESSVPGRVLAARRLAN